MPEMLEEISNELFLTGNLFPMFSVDQAGMSYVRIYPTDQIEKIQTAENDLRQEKFYITKELPDAHTQTFINPRGMPTATTPQFMEHFAINKLAGTCWGEGEIWPDLPWLGRYASWLEDRVRLNRYRTAYMFVLQAQFIDDEAKKARQRQLNANPPQSGSILVTDPSERWGILSPQLDSFDASMDGMAIKRMIAVNHAPMHYLAEPESSTSTTATAAGSPAFKAFENHRDIFLRILTRILTIARNRRAEKDNSIDQKAEIKVLAGDATERDNAALALATNQIVTAIGEMFDRNLIDEDEYIRLVYRFSGEVKPTKPTPKGIKRNLQSKPANVPSGIKTKTQTGEVTTP
jgi:hypothetical protein